MAAGSRMTAEIWSLTLEIIRLLTGETYPDGKPGDHVTITMSPPLSLKPDRHALQKILEVTRKITELLIEEMESPLELCLEVKAENETKPDTAEAGFSVVGGALWSDMKMELSGMTPVRSLLMEDGDGSEAEEPCKEEETSHVIGAELAATLDTAPSGVLEQSLLINVKPEEEEEIVFVKIEEEDIPLQINQEERSSCNETEEHAAIPSLGKKAEADITAQSTGAVLFSLPLAPSVCHTVSRPHHTARKSKKSFSHSSQNSQFINIGKVHTEEKSYSCSECGKSFSQKSHFVSHERVHTGEKPYSCSECGKCFSQKSNLTKHERVHTGKKTHSCSQCGKYFSQKSVLIAHQRVHTGEKPFSCSACGKRFSQKSDLIRHQRVHTGEKPYSCSECGKCFSDKSSLSRHEKLHTV